MYVFLVVNKCPQLVPIGTRMLRHLNKGYACMCVCVCMYVCPVSQPMNKKCSAHCQLII